MGKNILNVVSFSGGKDSTAMLLKMIEKGIPVDYVLFCDTGIEFPQMYRHIDKVEKETGITITRVTAYDTFENIMFNINVNRKPDSLISQKYGINQKGYGWPGPRTRWCTSRLKKRPADNFVRSFKQDYEIRHYIGIAADEQYRLERKTNQNLCHIHPLVDWGMDESSCLSYCYSKGYDWEGLYKYFKRVSCWCCPLQSLDELRVLRSKFPELWEKLKEWDNKNFRTFKAGYGVEELEIRFCFEEECIRAGKPIKGKKFMAELNSILNKTTIHKNGKGDTERVNVENNIKKAD